MENYYNILGVSKDATKKDIKKAYKSLAMKYHPDRTQGDKTLEDKFKQIKKAYEVLSDDQLRQQYDFSGTHSKQGNPYTNSGFGGFGGQQSQSFEDIFGGRGFGSDIFEEFRRGNRGQRPKQEATPTNKQFISLKTALKGGDVEIKDPNGRVYKISIPANTQDGKKIRIKPTENETIIVELKIKTKPEESIQGDNVTIKHDVDVFTLLVGGESIFDLFGKNIKIKIKECSQNGSKLKIAKQGFNDGDLFIQLNAKIPESISEEQKEILQGFK